VLVQGLLQTAGFDPDSVDGIAVGSVVPPVTGTLREACAQYFRAAATLVIDARSALPIRLEVDEPLTVGADRLINTLAASRLFNQDAIVVDLGTATTFDCITSDGAFLGGIIAPGVRSSAETLFRRASKLSATELTLPTQVIGKRTEECIRAGVMYGAADSIDGLVRRLKAAWPRPAIPIVIGTGGLAETLGPLCREFTRIEPYLTLQGLQIAHAILATGGAARYGTPSETTGFVSL